MITCFYVHMFWYSHTSMITCYDNHMLLCLHALTRTCPFAYMPWCSYAWTLLWLDAPMLTCFVDHMYLSSHFTMITCFHVYMLWWSHTHLLYDFELIHENINSYEHQSLKHFKIGALKIMLECWDDWVIWGMCTLVLKCSYECTLSWSHALLITYSRLSLLWW